MSRGPVCRNRRELDEMGESFLRALVRYVEIAEPAVVFEETSCVQMTFHPDYWQAKAVLAGIRNRFLLYLLLGITVAVMFAVAIVIFIVYMRRRRKKEQEMLLTS